VNILKRKILTCLCLVNIFERKGERGLGFCTGILLKVTGLPIQGNARCIIGCYIIL